jgi:hypothetical protein
MIFDAIGMMCVYHCQQEKWSRDELCGSGEIKRELGESVLAGGKGGNVKPVEQVGDGTPAPVAGVMGATGVTRKGNISRGLAGTGGAQAAARHGNSGSSKQSTFVWLENAATSLPSSPARPLTAAAGSAAVWDAAASAPRTAWRTARGAEETRAATTRRRPAEEGVAAIRGSSLLASTAEIETLRQGLAAAPEDSEPAEDLEGLLRPAWSRGRKPRGGPGGI